MSAIRDAIGPVEPSTNPLRSLTPSGPPAAADRTLAWPRPGRGRCKWLSLILLVGCDRPSSTVEAYLAALSRPGDGQNCQAIADDSLRGECKSMAASELARAGRIDDALVLCEAVDYRVWRDECHFLVADSAGVTGDVAATICRSAGSFRKQCLGHAATREIQVLLDTSEIGAEPELIERVEEAYRRYSSPAIARGSARRKVADLIGGRSPHQPFSAAMCGAADADLCRDGFVARVLDAAHDSDRWRDVCVPGQDPAVLSLALGLPRWAESFDADARAGWQALCARVPTWSAPGGAPSASDSGGGGTAR